MALINIECDTLTSVRTLARQRLGKNIAPSTIWRWVRKGSRGCRLEAVQVLGTWHSTPPAFAAFITGQTAAAYGTDAPTTAPAERTAATQKKLRAAGLLS